MFCNMLYIRQDDCEWCLVPVASCVLAVPIAYCLFNPYCLLPVACCLLPVAYCLLPVAYLLMKTVCL